MKTVSALSQRQDKMEANLENVTIRVQNLENGDLPERLGDTIEEKVQDMLRARMEEITREMEGKVSKLMDDLKAADVGSHRGRLIDRSKNLLIFKEEEIEDETKRKEGDDKTVQSILRNTLRMTDMTAKSVERIGVYDKERRRPILVTMKNRDDRNAVLRKIIDIRTTDKELIKTIFISADMSQTQRRREAELRAEVRRRRDAGEQVMIRNKKVVKKDNVSESTHSRAGQDG